MKLWHVVLILGIVGWISAGSVAVPEGNGGSGTTDGGGTADIVTLFSEAIAYAEGFWKAGSTPQQKNNPGDLKSGGVIRTFASADDGWQALYTQVGLMFYGGSAYYNSSMSIAQIGWIYADGTHDPNGAANWAANVAGHLGVSSDTTLNDLMGAA